MPGSALAVPDDAVPVCEPVTTEIPDGSKATVEFSPDQSGSVHKVPVVAISKAPDTSYRINFDGGSDDYGPAGVPPTDIDDLAAVWTPPEEFRTRCKVVIKNLGNNPRTYHVQLIGWEE